MPELTPAQWGAVALALAIAAPACIAILYALCRAAGEADDRADAMQRDMEERGQMWSHK